MEEKIKVKSLNLAIREKQEELSQALQFTHVQDMENRLNELLQMQVNIDKQLGMLERIKNE